MVVSCVYFLNLSLRSRDCCAKLFLQGQMEHPQFESFIHLR